MSDWFQTGYDEVEKTLRKEASRQSAGYGPGRFWMPADSEREFILVDEDPVAVYEHNPKLNGSYRNWLTCNNGVCCEILGADTRYYVGFFTCVDLSEWTDKQGNKHKYELRLYPAKSKTLKKFKRKIERGVSLAGKLILASRTDSKSPNVGDDFEIVREADMTKLFDVAMYRGRLLKDLWDEAESDPEALESLRKTFQVQIDDDGKPVRRVVPFNYFEVLKPKDDDFVREFLGAPSGGAVEDVREDDIPF